MGNSIIANVIGTEALSESFKYTLTVYANPAEDPLKDPLKALGKALTLTIKTPAEKRCISGIITEISNIDINQSKTIQYKIVIESWLAPLRNQQDCRLFQNKNVVDIIKTIIQPYSYCKIDNSKLSLPLNKLEHITQYNETSCAFILRILAGQGISFYFHHSSNQHTMVLLDSGSTPAQYTNFIDLGCPHHSNEPIYFYPRATVTAEQFSQNQYNYLQPQTNLLLLQKSKCKRKQIFKQPLEQHCFPGMYQQKSQGDKKLDQLARREDQQSLTYQSASHSCAFHPGLKLHVIDKNQQHNTFIITSIEHTIVDQTGLDALALSEQAAQHYSNCFTCLKQSSIPLPALKDNPQMQSSQTATVIGHAGKDIHTDHLARIKVRFHWDRYYQSNPNQAGWIRCKQMLAGNKHGCLFLPRVGSEVIVDFIDNDPDRPIVTGQVYNSHNNTPFNLEENYTGGLQSRTFKTADKHDGNILRFNDKSDEEELWIHAQKNLHIIAGNNFNSSVKQNESEMIIKGNKNITVKNDYELTANTKISFQCGKSTITMDKSCINILGESIAIN